MIGAGPSAYKFIVGNFDNELFKVKSQLEEVVQD
jgi:hypothetical protein